MSLKSAVFEIKEAIVQQRDDLSEDRLIEELEAAHGIEAGKLVPYYNYLRMFEMNKAKNPVQADGETKKVNRKWTKSEMEFMFLYIKERQEEGSLNITDILEEVSQLLDRGYQSVNYKYYSLAKVKENKKKRNEYNFTTIEDKELAVQSVEYMGETGQRMPLYSQQGRSASMGGDENLLDMLSGLISNIQQLQGINLNDLMKSLYTLTNMAIENQNTAELLENAKSEINHEKQALREKLIKQEQQLKMERKRNEALQAEIAQLAKEITAFNKLEDAAKIQNLKSYNQRLNYLIDGAEAALQFGS